MSNREYAKLEAINNFVYELILYKEAVANGYTLTEEESEKVEENVNSFINDLGLSEKFLKENGFTPEFLRDVFTRNTLATRFKQDVIDSLDIDDEAIKAEFKYEDYRQYDIEYLFISTAPTETDDEESDDNKANEVKKQTALEKITSYRKRRWKPRIVEACSRRREGTDIQVFLLPANRHLLSGKPDGSHA